MIAAVVLVLTAAPQDSVVRFESGYGFFVDDSVVLTTHAVVSKALKAELVLIDGGMARPLRLPVDDAARDFAVAMVEGSYAPLSLGEGPREGARVTVYTQSDAYEATVRTVQGDDVTLDGPDAGELGGAPVVDAQGKAVAVMRGPGRAGNLKTLLAPPVDTSRYRNLGISIAFFLGLMVWWRYRLKARRY